ncbi:MAG: hypothetical protein ACJ74Y_14355 [Bryobacteraceae bacterium]|jgi:hypothetical protein
MAKFYGKVGYAHSPTDSQNGVWTEVMIERPLYGDVVRNTRRLITGEDLNSDLTTGNSISVVADAYALDNIFAIRYVEWMGSLWVVTDVEVQAPRLLLRLGGVYNGPTPTAPATPAGGTG